MKIAFFSDTYKPNVDGVVTAMENLQRGLEEAGHEVQYFVPSPKNASDREAGVHYAPSIPFPPYPQYRGAYFTGKIERECSDWKPDIIHSHAMATMALAARGARKKCRAPLIGTFHTMLPDGVHYITNHEHLTNFGKDLSWKYLRWVYGDFDELTSPSEYVRKLLLEHGIESTVVPGGIDTKKFSPGAVPKEIGAKMGEEGRKFVFVGRIVKEKNLDYILELAKTKEWRGAKCQAHIVGDGPYRKTLEEKIAGAVAAGAMEPGAISFEGRLHFDQLVGYYRAADIFIFPSRFETQGLVAIEAMACGTPVAAFDDTAAGEIVSHHKTGAHIALEDSPSQAMEKILHAAEKRKKMADKCRKTALAFDISLYAKRMEKIYKKLA